MNYGSAWIIPRPFRGLIPPMVTPLTAPDLIDAPAVERLVSHILAGGVQGLFILGTTGEGPSLSYRTRRELIELVCREVGMKIPVLVAITDTSREESVAVGEVRRRPWGFRADAGCAPYYYPLTQEDLAGLCRGASRPGSAIAVFPVQHAQPYEGELREPETRSAGWPICPTCVGSKIASGDLDYFQPGARSGEPIVRTFRC